ncbi:hypothetical protein [Streptomyces eurythermus]|uniref:hypothetical protein n=1 Tax=Streptomyces eurythermus TaxID=42237 RepID=UPI0036FB42D0
MVEVTAYFGFACAGSSDDGRERSITTASSPTYAKQVLELQEAGATEEDLHPIVAEAITESYFTESGTWTEPPFGETYYPGEDDPDYNPICNCSTVPRRFCMSCADCAACRPCTCPPWDHLMSGVGCPVTVDLDRLPSKLDR